LVIEAKSDNDQLFLNEAADLIFHYMILLSHRGYGIADVVKVLQQRHAK
jgi:phosphoribosyl-ATP pyrophosphohydrolase/phosphoribosyl-AMP cyclohydrolase